MPLKMLESSILPFIQGMRSLAVILDKGRASAEARNIAPDVLVQARLAPDMHTLARQVQIASDMVKNGAARLAGMEPPKFEDSETSFAQLQARIDKTIAFLETVTEGQLEGSEAREVTLKFPGREMTFTGATYLRGFVLPNLYFHITTAYNILRHNGVPLSKTDYMGG